MLYAALFEDNTALAADVLDWESFAQAPGRLAEWMKASRSPIPRMATWRWPHF